MKLIQRVIALAVFCLAFGSVAQAACKANGNVLFQDQFNELDASWGTFENYRAEDGKLVIQPPAGYNTSTINTASLYDDVDICVEMTVPPPVQQGNCGSIIFWAVDYDNYYSLQVSTDGQAAVWRRQKGKWLNQVAWQDFASVRKTAETVNELRVTTAGNKAKLFINGKLFKEVKGQPPAGGSQIGLLGCSPNKVSAAVQFDNFVVTGPGEATPPVVAGGGSRGAVSAGCQPVENPLFADKFDTLEASWGNFQNYKVDKGELLITPPAGYNTATLNTASLYDDIDMCVEMKVRAPITEGTCGSLIIWAVDFDNYYSFQISTEGQASFWRRQRGKWLNQIAWQAADGINTGNGAVNVLRVTTESSVARLFINGNLFKEVRGQPPTGGQEIGLLACAPNKVASAVSFDNLTVAALGAKPAAAVEEPVVVREQTPVVKAKPPVEEPVIPKTEGRRVALIIGNSNYKAVPVLPNPTKDAADIAAELTDVGFDVTHLEDLDVNGLRRALRDFEQKADGASIALVYYAGHGMEVDGINYLIPVDAELERDTHVEDEAIPLSRVLTAVQGARDLRLILLDACRNNPFLAKMARADGTRAVSRGLARIEPGGSTLVAYAAKEGTTADDGNGRNSPFAKALLANLKTPGLEVSFLFRKVRDQVLSDTGGRQEPFVYGSLSSIPIYLAGQ
jgi:regulation of enolase protein 1 (concanavalin A-like superfamily)